MKFTISWLKEHLETDASLDEISRKLTSLGLEVEDIKDPAAIFAPFVVAEVLAAKPHPDADKLQICTVTTGSETLDVVCGAANARTGLKGIFAPAGSTVPGTGMELRKVKIRGVESSGMLCSESEMGLSEEHEGIIELPASAKVGMGMAEAMGLDDPVIEIQITPDRQDCLGVDGIARDLAADGLGKVLTKAPIAIKGTFKSPIGVTLEFDKGTEDACPLFVGRYIRGVKNGPSPAWLQKKLTAIGLRPISALVDITNLLTFDRGRPLHVFDADKVSGPITARLGRDGEKLQALDDNEYIIDPEMCVIADAKAALGLAGVIGGAPSGVTEDTVNVFIEAAYFDPIRTAMTGRKLGILSDARYRFERGVDPEFVGPGMELATKHILELCGGEASETVIAGSVPEWQRDITFRFDRVRSLTGLEIKSAAMTRILKSLEFGTRPLKDKSGLMVAPPSWRRDIEGEADLVEEVARIHGYGDLPSTALPRTEVVTARVLSKEQARVSILRRSIAAIGYSECISYSFIPAADAEIFGGGSLELTVENPISMDMNTMRPSLMPGLLAAVRRNVARGHRDLAFFELGPQFEDDTPEGQTLVAAAIRRGDTIGRHWSGNAAQVDAYAAKADVLMALSEIGAPIDNLQITTDASPWYHPGRSAVLRLGPKNTLAQFGELHPRILASMDVEGPAAGFEIFVASVPFPRSKGGQSKGSAEMSDYQSVERDFAFLVDHNVLARDILRAARGAEKALITDASIFDVYEGEHIDEGKKSIAFSVRLQAGDRTLTEAEIEGVSVRIIAAVEQATGGTLRS